MAGLNPAPITRAPAQAPQRPAAQSGRRTGKGRVAEIDETEQPKKSKKKLIIVLVVVALLGVVFLKEKSKFIKPHYSLAHPAPNGQVYALPTSSPITVTTANGDLVQTGVALQLTTVANTKELTEDEPALENAVISVLGSDTYSQLLSPAGRAQARQEILQRIQQVLGTVDGSPQVTKVFFTGSFVLQQQ